MIVAFEVRPRIGLFRLLTEGFQHCYLFVEKKDGWIKIDPMNVEEPASEVPPIPAAASIVAGLAAVGIACVVTRMPNAAYGTA